MKTDAHSSRRERDGASETHSSSRAEEDTVSQLDKQNGVTSSKKKWERGGQRVNVDVAKAALSAPNALEIKFN